MQDDTSGFPILDLSGTGRERGMTHGREFKSRVWKSIALYRKELERRGAGVEQTRAVARRFIPEIQAFDAEYLEEMQGIAEGAEVPLEDIVLVNCRTEMLWGIQQLLKQAPPADKDDGCTTLIVLPEASQDGQLIHAHNWDWREECTETGVILRIQRPQGPDILTFTEAGTLARLGLNSKGLTLTGNYLSSDRDFQQSGGTPQGLLRRKILEAETLAGAMRTLWGTRRACSTNVMLGAAEGDAVNLELAPDEIFWITPTDGILVHANHWISPPARAKLRDTGLAVTPDSIYRQRRVEASLRQAGGKISIEQIKAALADRFATPDSVLRPPRPTVLDAISATVCTTVMTPAQGLIQMARRPWIRQEFVEYTL